MISHWRSQKVALGLPHGNKSETKPNVKDEIGQIEQQFSWEVLYNLYVLHVGA
jgi:hypothetical protein